MDRKELLDDPVTAILAALDGRQSTIWTALPAEIITFDPDLRTCTAQVTIQAMATDRLGNEHWLKLPPLLDCPVLFPGGKGYSLTFPLVAGDEVLVIFSSRCIDLWFQRGGIQRQAELRMHDLSDGFCFPQGLSAPSALARAPVSMDGAELRNASGSVRIKLADSNDVEVVTPADVSVEAANATVAASGSAELTAGTAISLSAPTINLNGLVMINGQPYLEHQHDNVTNGDDVSGGVV